MTNKQISPVDHLKRQLSESNYQKQISNYFNGDKEASMRFMTSVVTSVQKTPKLLECDRSSLMTAFMTCAELKLYPSNVSGEAYVLPYKDQAQFQLGYQGIITLLYRAGMEKIYADIVYEKDEFTYESGLNPVLIHKPKVFENRGEPIGVYAVATVKGGEKLFKVLSKNDVMKFKEFSKSKDSSFTPWNPKNDPELHMWRKTAVKQLAKFLPKNDQIFKAIEQDNKDSRINESKDLIETSGLKMGDFLETNEKNQDIELDTSESQEVEPGKNK